MKRRVVITGFGTINPIGNNAKETWESVAAGRCGIDKISLYDASERKVKLAAEVKNPDFESVIEKKELRKMDRYSAFAMMAASEAIEMSGLDYENADTGRWGTLISSGIGGIGTIESEDKRGLERGYDKVSPFFIPMSISNMAAGNIAIKYNLKGMCSCVVSACAGATNAIGDAYRHIKDGYGDVMVCGGAEAAVTPLSIGGFSSMHALCTSEDPLRASIPFDKERSGFVMGEGAGILVLEEYEHAKKRGAKIYGELAGYGANCDAYHITSPDPSAEGAAACMKQALSDAEAEPSKIDYINAHGTSTSLNDKTETLAIRKVFDGHADELKVSSTKSMTGHLLGASGGVEAVITVMAILNSFVPPTIGYKEKDEECDLDIVPNKGINMQINYAMSNSLGFGGHNAAIIIKRFEE
ncbi:MAG: beta-ketoacyl-ACP synthase II [Eubacterium sp.]|nr:beta-ketoacyl-ACP synthase II [Eubacterium sp.]